MKFKMPSEGLDVIGGYCTVQEIAELMLSIKSLEFDERYDLYSELFREGWPTDAGYIMLPNLCDAFDCVEDLIDFEVVYLTGLIQRSIITDGEVGDWNDIVRVYVKVENVKKTRDLLIEGKRFCNPNLTEEQCQELIVALSSFC
jgi:hypothetical protein